MYYKYHANCLHMHTQIGLGFCFVSVDSVRFCFGCKCKIYCSTFLRLFVVVCLAATVSMLLFLLGFADAAYLLLL